MVVQVLDMHMPIETAGRHEPAEQYVELRTAVHQFVCRADRDRASDPDAHDKPGKGSDAQVSPRDVLCRPCHSRHPHRGVESGQKTQVSEERARATQAHDRQGPILAYQEA